MNPFAPGDKVITKHKGVEVEATVRLVWNDEVQVRTQPDNVLRWRTVKTVRLAAVSAPTVDASAQAPAAAPTEQPPTSSPLPSTDAAPESAPAAEAQPAPQEVQEPAQAEATNQPKTNVVPCGATEVQPKAQRSGKARRRR